MKTCNHCNQTKKETDFYKKQGKCKECCIKIAKAKYYDEEQGKHIKKVQKLRYETKKEEILQYHKERNKDPEVNAKKIKYLREYRQQQEVKEAHAKKILTPEYIAKQAEKRFKKRKRYKNQNDKTVTPKFLKELQEVQEHKCFYCHIEFSTLAKGQIHLDHYIPLSKGGLHSIGNLVYACQKCNLTKSDTIPTEPLTFPIKFKE